MRDECRLYPKEKSYLGRDMYDINIGLRLRTKMRN